MLSNPLATVAQQNDTIIMGENPEPDSLALAADSLVTDSLRDTVVEAKRKSSLDYDVTYQCDDSMLIDLQNERVYLYGNAVAEYGDIKLEAAYIEIALGASELHATGLPDSTGEIAGLPHFTQGTQTFRSEEMRYNFKTQRGLSKNVKTQEGEGYLHGEAVKKDSGNVIYIRNGKYTTCELDDPHFYIHAGKLKVITEDKIVTGPAYLSIASVPTFLAVPFGFFPNSENRANGVIIPSYGQSAGQGFFLSRGGYYFGVGDRMDFAITGDIYTRGSYAGYLNSNYAKRYRYNGRYGIELIKIIYSEKGYPDYFTAPLAYRLRWDHKQDPKAHPNQNFGADVDFGTPQANRVNQQSSNANYLRSNVNSNIRFSKNFPGTPLSFVTAVSSSQNANTGLVNMKLPNASLNMARIYPFKNDKSTGQQKAWEKIGVNATMEGTNQLSARSDTLFKESTFKKMQNGLQMRSDMAAGYKVMKYFTLTPSVSNRVVGYRSTTRYQYDSETKSLDTLVQEKASAYWEGNGSLSLSTVIYGIYQYKSERIKAMRHQFTPSASLSYKPDYSDPQWGYYETIVSDSVGKELFYSPYAAGIYGGPGAQENGVISLNAANTFELKVRNNTDTTGEGEDKKVRLLDALNFSTSYAIARDSMKLAPLGIQVRTTAVKGLAMNGSATVNPYARNARGVRINEFMYDRNGKIGNWTSANAALSWTLAPKANEKKSEEKKKELEENNLRYDDFVDFDIPWRVSFNYNIGYSLSGFRSNVTHNLGMNGDINVTRNWKVGFQTNIDIRNQKLAFTTFDIYRDLHCWEMSLRVVPFGPRQSYNFQINVKSSILQDLKLSRNRQYNVPERI